MKKLLVLLALTACVKEERAPQVQSRRAMVTISNTLRVYDCVDVQRHYDKVFCVEQSGRVIEFPNTALIEWSK